MVANINNIDVILNDIPNTFVYNGVKTDNYKKSTEHYLHGWREVVIPNINEYQRLGTEWIVLNDVITKEVIDFTTEEINALRLNKAVSIDLEYKAKITTLLRIPIEKVMCGEYESIPNEILIERDRLREECNAKILELGITDFTYRKKIKGL